MNIKKLHTHVPNNDESTDKRGIKACTYHHIVIQVNNKELHAAKHSNRPFIILSSLFTIDLQFYSLQGHLFISLHKSIPLFCLTITYLFVHYKWYIILAQFQINAILSLQTAKFAQIAHIYVANIEIPLHVHQFSDDGNDQIKELEAGV